MKKLIILWTLLTVLIVTPAHADTIELQKMTLTCYYPTGNKTCTGIVPHYGVVASKREWVGKTAIVYKRNADNTMGEYIGTFDIQDTGEGRNGAVRKGYVLDVFIENESQLIPTQKIYVYIVDSEG